MAALVMVIAASPAMRSRFPCRETSALETETIWSFVDPCLGESYTPARIDQAIKDLHATGSCLADVRVRRAGSGIVVSVCREFPHQSRDLRSGYSKKSRP